MSADQTLREVEFIEASLAVKPGGQVLDIGCGYGRHAIELVQRGLDVTGLDLSLPLLLRAADEAQKRAMSVNFVHADMREMAFEKQFDGAYCMLTSFGYFDEETNLRVAEGIARALKPGGRFLLDLVNRDYVVSDLPSRVWWEGNGCVVLEEVDFNFHTSRILTHRSIVFEDGRQVEQEISVRAYSLARDRSPAASGRVPGRRHLGQPGDARPLLRRHVAQACSSSPRSAPTRPDPGRDNRDRRAPVFRARGLVEFVSVPRSRRMRRAFLRGGAWPAACNQRRATNQTARHQTDDTAGVG